MINKGVEKRLIKRIAFGMVLHTEAEGIIAQACLFDHVVVRAPGLDLEAGAKLIQRLVVRAINVRDLYRGARGIAERLDIVELQIGSAMTGDIEMQGSTKRDVEDLQAATNGEDGQMTVHRFRDDGKFPGVASAIRFFDLGWIRYGLM